AKRCQAFGMRTIAYDPYLSKEIAEKNSILLLSSFDELLRESDFLSIHSVLTNETRNMLRAPQFKTMKPSAYVVNIARGGIIDEDDLSEAIRSKIIAGAAIDTFDSEPLPTKSQLRDPNLNILLTPHIGASTHEAQKRAGTMVAEEVLKVLAGKRPDFCVNPEVLGK
ncbi:MAG TPA: NAD(P)-dependent oxidoreductase, partial [Candidatus Hodarchaeales archaeon]|nr:NAD(P)-dependent oxidoreductase [Candidatus Hodarchaeales archaeon]